MHYHTQLFKSTNASTKSKLLLLISCHGQEEIEINLELFLPILKRFKALRTSWNFSHDLMNSPAHCLLTPLTFWQRNHYNGDKGITLVVQRVVGSPGPPLDLPVVCCSSTF